MPIPEQLLARFVELSGQKITLSAMRMEVLAEMATRQFTPDDVALVWHWVKHQIRRNEGGYNTASLQFGTLLGRNIADVDRFEDKLQLARQSRFARSSVASRPLEGAAPSAPKLDPEEEERIIRQAKEGAEELRKKFGR